MQFAFLLAIATQRVFLIHGPDSEEFSPQLSPNLVNWRVPEIIDMKTVAHLHWHTCEHRMCSDSVHGVDFEKLTPPDYNGTHLNYYTDDLKSRLEGYEKLAISARPAMTVISNMRKNSYLSRNLGDLYGDGFDGVQTQRMFLHALFRKSEALQQRICAYNPPPRYYSVHIRTSADTDDGIDKQVARTEDNIESSVQELWDCVKRLKWNEHPIYIASDSKVLKTRLSERMKVANVSVFEGSGDVTGEQDALVDLMYLAGSNGIVTTSSGFARRAFTLGHAKWFYEVKMNAGGQSECSQAQVVGQFA